MQYGIKAENVNTFLLNGKQENTDRHLVHEKHSFIFTHVNSFLSIKSWLENDTTETIPGTKIVSGDLAPS